MFGWFKKGNPPSNTPVQGAKKAAITPAKPSKDALIAEAMANAKLARDAIGQDTLDRLSEMMEKQARRAKLEKIKSDIIRKMETDSERMADELKYMLQDKKSDH